MAHDDKILQETLRAQARMFRLAQRDGLCLNAISLESGIPYNTIRSYAGNNGEIVQMPISAVNKLRWVLPNELLSHLLEPSGGCISNSVDCDHDSYAAHCDEWRTIYREAVHPDSPAGREISDCEDRVLSMKRAANEGKRA